MGYELTPLEGIAWWLDNCDTIFIEGENLDGSTWECPREWVFEQIHEAEATIKRLENENKRLCASMELISRSAQDALKGVDDAGKP